jgi:hypothetical protein
MWSVPTLLILASLGACAPPPEAPTELNDLVRYLYREWPAEDPEVLADGIRNIEAFLADIELVDVKVGDRSWTVEPLDELDVEGVDRPTDRVLADLVGVAVSYRSEWSVTDHAQVQSEADQTPFEPTASDHYDRTFFGISDSACFVDRSCLEMETKNDATRANILFTVTFELFKDFRWIEVGPDRWAFISRSWFAESWTGAKDNTTLWQSFSTDLWIGQEDGTTIRVQVPWSESDLGISTKDEAVAATVKSAADGIFKTADEQIGALYYPDDQ